MAKSNASQIGALVEQCYNIRERRIELERKAEEMKAEQKAVEDQIIGLLRRAKLESGGSGVVTATIMEREDPRIEDTTAFYAYIKKTGSFDLLEKRPAKTACRERLDAGKVIPGIKWETVTSLSLNKKRS